MFTKVIVKVITPKQKYTPAGPWFSVITGLSDRQHVELKKFNVAATGTTFPGIISGMYIQTAGPMVAP